MPDDEPTSPEGPGPGAVGGGGTPPDDPGPPTILSRSELRAQREGGSNTKWYVLAGVAVVLVGAVIAILLTRGTTPAKAIAPTTTTTTHPAAVVATCPLTGTPPPGGTVPARPALAVKIGNYSGDRPSSGLNQADIVFEEPVEGSYTRLVAVFQCQGSALVGDMRSAREPDVAILSQLSDPVFLHAGGIDPVLALLSNAPIKDENVLLGGFGSVTLHPSGRVAPYATFTATAPAWALVPGDVTPPAPIFAYSTTPPSGAVPGSGQSVHIPFSTDADVTWTWNPATSTYLRSYSGSPDKLLDGSQTATTNVVILTVPTSIGPWFENSEGGREVEVTATGSGPLVVMRNGMAITGTWTRQSLTAPATLVATNGTPITLAPGNTWEELAPQGVPVSTTAAPLPAATVAPGKSTTPHHQGLSPRVRPTRWSTRRSAGGQRPSQVVEGGDGGVLADPVPVARHGEPDGLAFLPRPGQADEDGADRSAVLFGRAGHTGDRQSDIGTEHPSGPLGHGHGRPLGHDRTLGHAEDVELHLGGIADHRAAEPGAGPGHVDQSRGGQSPGERLGQPEGEPVSGEGLGHRVLDGLVVDAEHHVARRIGQDPADGLLMVVQGRHRGRLVSAERTVTRTLMPSMPLARKAMVAVLPDPSADAWSSRPLM